MNEFVITVTAEILPGKADPSAAAQFANAHRAGQYAALLVETGDYSAVYVTDETGTIWPVTA